MSYSSPDDISLITDFIKGHDLAVLATVTHDFLPQASVMGFTVLEDLELVIGTFRSSRKYSNLQKNPRVALVIGWHGGKTVQYEGQAQELVGDELIQFKDKYLESMPTAAKYVPATDAVYYKISPKWIKFTDASRNPWHIVEIHY
jgi:uncharacterized protein YhbP (UPF0306 family)